MTTEQYTVLTTTLMAINKLRSGHKSLINFKKHWSIFIDRILVKPHENLQMQILEFL